MNTKDTAVADMIRTWAGRPECDDYKDMAAEMADAIRGRAMDLEGATECGRGLTPTEASAIDEVKHHMPCGYNSPRTFWEWYNS